jgi:endo-1,4-beta-D-glucanase Y
MAKLAGVVAVLFGLSAQAAMADESASEAFKNVYVQEVLRCMLFKNQMFDDKVSSAVVVGTALNQFCANALDGIAQDIIRIDGQRGQHSVDTLNELSKEDAIRIVLYVRANPQHASCVQCIAKAFSQQ